MKITKNNCFQFTYTETDFVFVLVAIEKGNKRIALRACYIEGGRTKQAGAIFKTMKSCIEYLNSLPHKKLTIKTF